MNKTAMLYLEGKREDLFDSLGEFSCEDFEEYRMTHSAGAAYLKLLRTHFSGIFDFLAKTPKQRLGKKYYQSNKDNWLELHFCADVALIRVQELLPVIDSLCCCNFSCPNEYLVQKILNFDSEFYYAQCAFLGRTPPVAK